MKRMLNELIEITGIILGLIIAILILIVPVLALVKLIHLIIGVI